MKKTLLLLTMSVFWLTSWAQLPELIYYQFDNSSAVVNYASNPVGTNPSPVVGSLTLNNNGFQGSSAISGTGVVNSYVDPVWNVDFTGGFTLAFWLDSVPSGAFFYLFGDQTASSFRCFANGAAGTNNLTIRGGGFPNLEVTNALINGPNMIHVVYDPVASTYTSYMNGVLNNQATVTATPSTSGTGFSVGGYGASAGLNGIMDEFRWYNRALPASEIAATFDVDLNFGGNCANAYTNVTADSLTPTTAEVSWTPGTGNTSFWLEYGSAGFTPGTGTKVTGTYPGTQPPVYITGLSVNSTYDYYIGEICNSGVDSVYATSPLQFTTPKLCYPSPSNITVSNIQAFTADLAWTSTGTRFIVEYGPCGYTQGTGMVDTVKNLNTHTLTGLSGNTEYDVYVARDCKNSGNGISDWTNLGCFTTACAPFNTPFTETFDNTPVGSSTLATVPTCWEYFRTDHTNNTGYYGYTYNYSSANSSPNVFRMYTGSKSTLGDTLGIISPEVIDMDVTDKMVEFYAASQYSGTAYDCSLIIGTMSSASDYGSFKPIDTVRMGDNTSFQYYRVMFNAANGYNGTDKFIAIIDNSDINDSPLIDDITVSDIPNCPPPIGQTVTNITNSTALLSWDPASGIKSHIEYGPVGFTQGTGNIYSATGSSYTITGLGGSTCYDVYMRDSCVTGNGPWYGPITFCTKCDPQNTPLFEDFESVSAGSSTNPNMPGCWEYWTAPSTLGYGYSYSSTSPNGTRHFRMYSSTANTTDSVGIFSPAINGITTGTKMMTFYAKSSSSSYNMPIVVGTSAFTDLRNFNPIDTIYSDGTSYTDLKKVYFDNISSGYNGTDQYVGIMHGNSTLYTVIYLDDITITDIPACAAPWDLRTSAITSNSAVAEWTSLYGTSFSVEYGTQGFTPGTGTIMPSSASPANITGLAPNTYYDFYVTDNCGTNLVSGPFTFKTECVGQLTGTYSVGLPTSDFKSLDSALAVLGGCGVSGPVILNLEGTTHTLNSGVVLPNFSGSSATNTVSIVGNANGLDTIKFASGNIGFDLDGTQYLSFSSLTIDADGMNRAVWMHNACRNISFDQCNIKGDPSTSSTYAVITANTTSNGVSNGGDQVDNLTITNCTITGGYYGVNLYGAGVSSQNINFTIENNTIESYYYPLRLYYIDGLSIKGNITNTTSTSTGYGCYILGCSNFSVLENDFYGTDYGLYFSTINSNSAPTSNDLVANNFVYGTEQYGLYLSTVKNVNFYHNSIKGDSRGIYFTGTNENCNIVNNIIVSNLNEAVYYTTAPSTINLDYNLYDALGTNFARWGSNTYNDLAAWQTGVPAINDSSLQGDPVFIAPDDFRIAAGTLANDAGDNSIGITTDIDGNARPATGSTRVDIGAYEYSLASSDIELISASLTKGQCLTQNDTVLIEVTNLIGNSLDMSVTPIVAEWSVTGPVNSSGTITLNTGTLALADTIVMEAYTVDMSLPGTYVLNAHINPSSYNKIALNDTAEVSDLLVNSNWIVTPESDTLKLITDTAELKAASPLFGGGNFYITEICHYAGATNGAPVGGKPSWLLADDYIEITGIPGSDLGGITLEQWNVSTMLGTFTFLPGTVLSPDGTAIIAIGQIGTSVESPANFYYHGNGTYTGSFSSGGGNGRILKDQAGTIIEAVGSASTYTFPATSGVTTSDWSTSAGLPSHSNSWGLRLEGPDLNGPTGWDVSSATKPQDPNMVNPLTIVPAPANVTGFTWTLNGNVVDTVPNIKVGPTTNGTYDYIATYVGPCGTFTDTVIIVVDLPLTCNAPTALTTTADCKDVTLTWTSDAATVYSVVEYGPAGFALGSGTEILNATSPTVITNLTPGTAYDFYVKDSCALGMSLPVKTSESTTTNPTTATFTWAQTTTTLNNAQVDFDASASTNAVAYKWDFGNSNTGVGATPNNIYTANGTYTVVLTVEGTCDTNIFTDVVTVAGISVEETVLDQTLKVYPNPNNGTFRVDFQVEGLKEVTIRVHSVIGEEVYNNNAGKVSGVYQKDIALNNLAEGVYVLQVITDNAITTRKITVRK